MTGSQEVISAISDAGVVPVVRTPDAETAIAHATRLAAAGCRVIELTATIPQWHEALAEVQRCCPYALVGLGTVVDPGTAAAAIESGARFLVSPRLTPEVLPVATEADLLFIQGGFTPTEIATALTHGPAKLFPAHVGGPAYLRGVLATVPGAMIMPTGGIHAEDVPGYLAAGAFSVGVGSADLLGRPDGDARVRNLLAAITKARA